MTGTLNAGVPARDYADSGMVHCLRKRITYANNGTAVTVGKIPPGASIVGGGVHIITAFNDSGTDLLDVGFVGATTDADAYATDLTLAAVGYLALDELGATTNIQGTVEHTVTATYAGQNSDATAGVADVIVFYVTRYPVV